MPVPSGAESGTGAAARLAAAIACREVLDQGRSLARVFGRRLKKLDDARDRALARRITLEVLRHRRRLEWQLDQLLKRPLASREADIHYLLLGGLAQLGPMGLAAHGVVHSTVEATRLAHRERLTGLVNAVLNNFRRRAGELSEDLPDDPEIRHGLPGWMLERLQSDWPDHWEAVARAAAEAPPRWLRVNRRRTTVADYRRRLEQAGLECRTVEGLADALVLAHPAAVRDLPGFEDGEVSVQDGGAQLAADWMEVEDGMRVLDACAAPGGKACHLLERADVDLVAVESEAERVPGIHENLFRLGLSARVVTADAADPESWWDGRAFDRILVDAPCSSTGVLRRHPEIRWLRRESDLAEYAAVQARLLARLWPLLRPGGMLVYITCSLFRSENAAQALAFLQDTPDARVCEPPRAGGEPAAPGRQILPGDSGMDGFYMVRFRRHGNRR